MFPECYVIVSNCKICVTFKDIFDNVLLALLVILLYRLRFEM